MDYLSSARFASVLALLNSNRLQYAPRHPASIEASNYAENTLKAVVGALKMPDEPSAGFTRAYCT
jgi:hypothetical protein